MDGIALYLQRRRVGISQTELGRRLGVSHAWISRVERDHRPVKPEEVKQIIAALYEQPAGTGTVAQLEEPQTAA